MNPMDTAQPTTSNQEFFDLVCKHLLTQKARSYKAASAIEPSDSIMCRYRGYGGLKCAAGCQIPDKLYRPSMESHGIRQLLLTEQSDDLKAYFPNLILACDLQMVHDVGTDLKGCAIPRSLGETAEEYSQKIVDAWPTLLRGVAEKYNLEWKHGKED